MHLFLQLWRVTSRKTITVLGFVVFLITIYHLPITVIAASLSYPACAPLITQEFETKLKEKLSDVQSVIECLKTEDGYFLRFEETALVSTKGNTYTFQSIGEANEDRITIVIPRRANRETLRAVLGIVESSAIHEEMIASIPNPARSLAIAGGLIIQIEARGATKPNLYFASAGTSTLRPIEETSAGINANLAPLSITSLGLQFSPLTLTNFSWSIPSTHPSTGSTSSLQASSGQAPPPPISGERIIDPAFAKCDPSTLRAVAFGERSDAVKNLQHCLIGLGYSIPAGATGYYGNQTVAALTLFYHDATNLVWHGRKFGPLGIETLKRIGMTAR